MCHIFPQWWRLGITFYMYACLYCNHTRELTTFVLKILPSEVWLSSVMAHLSSTWQLQWLEKFLPFQHTWLSQTIFWADFDLLAADLALRHGSWIQALGTLLIDCASRISSSFEFSEIICWRDNSFIQNQS